MRPTISAKGTWPRASTPSGTDDHSPPPVSTSRSRRPFAPHEGERLEQPVVVLVRPAAGRIEKERLALCVAGRQRRMVETERHDAYPRRIEIEPGNGALSHELADHDHEVRAAD